MINPQSNSIKNLKSFVAVQRQKFQDLHKGTIYRVLVCYEVRASHPTGLFELKLCTLIFVDMCLFLPTLPTFPSTGGVRGGFPPSPHSLSNAQFKMKQSTTNSYSPTTLLPYSPPPLLPYSLFCWRCLLTKAAKNNSSQTPNS